MSRSTRLEILGFRHCFHCFECLGDPLDALGWLARTALDFGEPLRAGQVVLSGALGPMVPVQPGTQVRAELNDIDGRALGNVTTCFPQEHS